MPRKSKAFLARSRAAKLGWQRRKHAERAEFKRHSEAAKKGWANRKLNKKIQSVKEYQTARSPKVMWRVTVSAPYYRRIPRIRNKKISRGSIASSYMVRAWYRTKREAQEALEELTDMAIDGRFDALEADRKAWWFVVNDTATTE